MITYTIEYIVTGATPRGHKSCRTFPTKEAADAAFKKLADAGWYCMDDAVVIHAIHPDGYREYLCECALKQDAERIVQALTIANLNWKPL